MNFTSFKRSSLREVQNWLLTLTRQTYFLTVFFEQEKYMFQIKPQMRYVDKMVNKNVSQLNGITATEGVIEAYLFFCYIF